jgi:hypothetical protein
VKVWASRVHLDRLKSREEQWVTEGYRLVLRNQEEHDEARAWMIQQHIPHSERSRLLFGSVGYDTQSYLILYRENDAFLAKLRWV